VPLPVRGIAAVMNFKTAALVAQAALVAIALKGLFA
jgi:hypothetical protein